MTESAELAVGAVKEVQDNAKSLGLNWILRPATIGTYDDDTNVAIATFDGDAESVPMISLVGYLAAGTRVMVMVVPPSGNYITGITGYVGDSAWINYSMVAFSTGVSPSVGSGSQGARWMKIGHKTIIFEGYVLFGAGMSQGTGRYFFPVPFARATNSFASTGSGYILDAGLANRGAFAVNFASLTTEVFLTNTPSGDVGAGVPQVFVSGDQILFSIIYEVASF